jgi:acetyltransferase-like isoleucine patch superfamily enzyme
VIGLLSSEARKLYIRTAYQVTFGPDVTIEKGVTIRAFDGGSVTIGGMTHIGANTVIEAKAAPIEIGPRAFINTGVFIAASYGITIGADALLAEYATIRDADHAFDDHHTAFNTQGLRGAPVVIGDNVWLAAKVTVTKGVTIGPGSIVGANSVVTRSIGQAEVWAGVPARLLRHRPE